MKTYMHAVRMYLGKGYVFVRSNLSTVAFVTLGLLVVLWAVFFYVPKGTIVLREDGFHPRVITIRAGESVTFVNSRSKYFWPASDFHPSHSLYPAFDAKEPLPPHARYTFTFTEPGTYPFHDHLAAYMFGVVRVTDAKGVVSDDCRQGGNFACWQKRIFLVLAEHGVDAAYDEVARLYNAEPGFAETCHYIAHNIGLASYQLYSKDMGKLLSPKAVVCAGGFYHGFMEGFLGSTGNPAAAGKMCDRIGEKVGKLSPDARLQCFHGIGHGAIETAVATLGASDVQGMLAEAIRMCEQSSTGEAERYRCVSGAYNGVANFFIGKQYGLSLDTGDPRALCSKQPEKYKEACYGELNSIAGNLAGPDMGKAITYVLAIPDIQYRGRAVQYVSGMYALEYSAGNDIDAFAAACEAIPKDYRVDCHRGAIRGLYEHGAPGKEYVKVFAYCRVPRFGEKGSADCFKESLMQLSNWYGGAKFTEACNAAPEDVRQYCK